MNLRFHVGWIIVASLGLVFAGVLTAVTMIQVNDDYNDDASAHWILVGGITSNSSTFRVRDDGVTPLRLTISTSSSIFDATTVVSTTDLSPTDQKVQALQVDGLASMTRYYYRLTLLDGAILQQGRFRTPAEEGTAFDFKVVSSGCAWTGSDMAVFDEIAKEDADLFLHLGDLHYEDIDSNDMDKRLNAIDKVLGSSSQRKAFSESGGLCYIWDDHDWLGNDSGYNSEGEPGGRNTALESYQLAFPHYPLVLTGQTVPVYHAFTFGTVRFIISDLRSEATETSIYNIGQKQWLQNELSQASQYDLVVWATSRPWIADSEEGSDMWAGYSSDRAELSTFLSETVGTTGGNLIAVASDAHMVAMDSGTNTYYGNASNATSFPILQTGPLDRLGSNKGGPYTEGCHTTKYSRNHQYSTLSFTFGAGVPCLDIKTVRVSTTGRKETIFNRQLCGNFFQESSLDVRTGSCDANLFETTDIWLFSVAMGLLFFLTIAACCFMDVREAVLLTFISVAWVAGMIAIGIGIPLVQGITQFDLFYTTLLLLCYTFSLSVSLGILMFVRTRRKMREGDFATDDRNGADGKQENYVFDDDESQSHEPHFDEEEENYDDYDSRDYDPHPENDRDYDDSRYDPEPEYDPRYDPEPEYDPRYDPEPEYDPRYDPEPEYDPRYDPEPEYDPRYDPEPGYDPRYDPEPEYNPNYERRPPRHQPYYN